MRSRSSKYWEERLLLLEEALNDRGIEYYHDLEEAYNKAVRDTNKDLTVFYTRLAKNNKISLTEAHKLLTSNELAEFRWTVEEYIEKAKENEITKAWSKELENASLRYRISRLEAMKVMMQNHAELLMGHEIDSISKLMGDIYTEGYYKTRHILDTGLGIGYTFAALDTRTIEKVLSKPWVADGRNFSERIWGVHRPQLINDLHKGLTQAVIRGNSSDKLIDEIAKKYKVAKYRAENLVLTERAYFSSLSEQECYRDLDVEYQEFSATLDLRTSDICREMDGKVFKTSEIEIGVNAPPLHCRCRSVMVPYFDGNKGTRAARNKDGDHILVDANMTYDEWFEKFINKT